MPATAVPDGPEPDGPMLGATVVVCAYTMQRWDRVVLALRSAVDQSVAPAQLLLVVDHNDELAARAGAELTGDAPGSVPGLRVLRNARRQGLSGARNTALLAATGDVVVFLDDDARAQDDGWLARLLAPYADPAVLGVGGTAQPEWPSGTDRPVTLPAGRDGVRGVLDWVVGCSFDGQPQVRGPIRNLMGCNMSLRREPALAAGGFAESLGRVGRTPLGCEETELCIRMTARVPGSTMLFEPRASVRHAVTPDRRTWSYLRRRGYAEGISKAAVSALVGSDAGLASERSYVTSVLPGAVARELGGLLRPGDRSRAGHLGSAAAVVLCLAATATGYGRGLAGHARSRLGAERAPLSGADRIDRAATTA